MDLDDVILGVHRLLLENLPARSTKTPGGWITFNCPVCNDRRKRAGISQTGAKITFNCFNCGFKTGWSPSPGISKKYRELSLLMGADISVVNATQIALLKNSEQLSQSITGDREYQYTRYPVIDRPDNITELTDLVPDHELVCYAKQRGVLGLHQMWHINNAIHRRRLVIPFYHNGDLVGFTGRHINPPDKKTPKYLHQIPQGFVFNLDKFTDTRRKIVVVCEGIFDAIMIDGVSILGNNVTAEQAHHISKLNLRVILCPDRDQAGKQLVDQAIGLGWEVSFPPWHAECKDAADAVARYGRLATLNSIIQHSTDNSIKIRVKNKLT